MMLYKGMMLLIQIRAFTITRDYLRAGDKITLFVFTIASVLFQLITKTSPILVGLLTRLLLQLSDSRHGGRLRGWELIGATISAVFLMHHFYWK